MTVRAVFDRKYELSPGALYELQGVGYHFSRDHSYYLTRSMYLSVAHTLQVVEMMANKTAGDKSDAEILDSLRDWVLRWI